MNTTHNTIRWASNEWASSRRQFVESLGHRSQLWSSSALVVKTGVRTVPPQDALTSFNRSSLPALDSAEGGAFSNALPRPTSTPTSSTSLPLPLPAATPTRSSSSQQLVTTTVQTSDLFRNQAQAVKNLSLGVYQVPCKIDMRPCCDLANCISIPKRNIIDQDGLSTPDLIGYKNVLDMLAEMTGEKMSRAPLPVKYFSTVCFLPTDVNTAALSEKKRFLTFHAIKHFQDQIWVDWSTAVDTSVQQGLLQLPPSNAGESRIQKLRAYVGQLWFSGDITPTRNLMLSPASANGTEIPVYAYIYHCLRVGEFKGAIKEVEMCLQSGVKDVERELLTCLLGYQNICKALTNNLSVITPFTQSEADALVKAMSVCGALYEEEKNKNEKDLDPYKESVFNILSMKNQAGLSETVIPGFSLEDYLWGNLWYVQWGALISRATMSSSISKLKILLCGESQLYEKVLEYGGADYFDADRSSPFNYCTVLMSCHRFGDAVAHLWQAGKLLPAVHLTVVCLHYGLILPHVPLTHSPKHPSNDHTTTCNTTPASLFEMFFSSTLLSSYPELTLDYLMTLDVQWNKHVQGIESKLLETQKLKSKNTVSGVFQKFLFSLGKSQLHRIVGQSIEESRSTDPTVTRTQGHIDLYMPRERVNLILTSCAYYLLTVKKESETAMELFQLAGRHSEVLEELCSLLSMAMTSQAAVSARDRAMWCEMSVAYYNTHIKVPHSAVLRCLTAENKLTLVGCFETLLNLSVFVDTCSTNPSNALDIIDGLFIFPKVTEEVQAAAQHFPTLDNNIKRVADDVLILTVECAKALYLRNGGTGAGVGGRKVLTDKEQER